MTIRKWAVLLLFVLLFLGGPAEPEQAQASDDVYYSEQFKQVYTANYDAIAADYAAGYTYILFCKQLSKCAIVLSQTPIYCDVVSGSCYICDSSGKDLIGDSYHSYLADGMNLYSPELYAYCASNYDVCRYDNGAVVYNARNLPDWFSVAYVDASDCPASIPFCNLLPDSYQDGYIAYYYYKDYPEYAFCTASDRELYVIRENSGTETACRFVGRVSNNQIVHWRDAGDAMYIYNRKLGIWSEFKNTNDFFCPGANSMLVTRSHMYDSLNHGDNFTLLGSSRPIKQCDFDSNDTLISEVAFSSGGIIGQLPSFPKAPAPELAGTVRKIQMAAVMTEVVGLIPLLVGLVISFLGLRKGLQVLFQALHRA